MQGSYSRLFSIGSLLIFASILLNGCIISSRVQQIGFCRTDLKPNDKILIPYIPSNDFTLILNQIKKKFDKRRVKASYLEEEEWNLKALGIANPLDSQYYEEIISNGFKYFLIINVLDKKSPNSFYNYYTPYEISQQNNPYTYEHSQNRNRDRSSIALVKFDLFSLEENKSVYQLIIRTSISSLTKKDKDGGETNINLSDQEMAINNAIVKGVKVITKKCKK